MRTFLRKLKRQINALAFILSGKSSDNLRNLKSLKNVHKGKRCFVVCNGPSLRVEDLTKIQEHGDISIGINLIGRVCDKTPWYPTYLSVIDDSGLATKANRKVVGNTKSVYKFYSKERFLYSITNRIGKTLFLDLDGDRKYLDNPVFNPDMTNNVPLIGTSTYFCLELAVYLGCSEIYIIGCDLSYKVNLNRDGSITFNDAGKDHFYKNEAEFAATSNVKPYPIWEMETAFAAAAKFASERGYNIKNATRGGKLEFFPRVDFDSLF